MLTNKNNKLVLSFSITSSSGFSDFNFNVNSFIGFLEEFGFEVFLVNARHTKNLPGRKSDVQESQWLLKLHTHGLLNNSFQPPSDIRVLRTYWRLRAEHATGMATCIQRMQKALTQMNIQLANVISDLSGKTGQAIVRAMLKGERDPQKLAELSDRRIHATKEEIAKSLQGNWRSELLFIVGQQLRWRPKASRVKRSSLAGGTYSPEPRTQARWTGL